ncbi:DUF4136 domain-containing protein [Porticoccaceae bacterium LTM1]|nr:DUF4136 domain-containing protein [Porticoccaceae bacterium LTM1]
MNRKPLKILGNLILFIFLVSCSSSPTIRTDYDNSVDLTSFKTFGFVAELGTDKRGYSSLITRHFKNATRAQMERLGYKYSESNPDLLVNFSMSVIDKSEVQSYSKPATVHYGGYYSYRGGLYGGWPIYEEEIRTVNYKKGTANIDVVDANRKQLIWCAIAEGRVKEESLENPGPAINTLVQEMFINFPK